MAHASAESDGPRSRPSTPGFSAARPGSRGAQARPLSAPSPGSSQQLRAPGLPTPRDSASGRSTPRGGLSSSSCSTLPSQQQQQTGHCAVTPVFNISPAPPAAPAAAAAPSTGKWKAAAGASGGPVFQLVSRGARLPTASPSLPAPPIKTHSTAPRTKARIGGGAGGDASNRCSSASVSLRRNLGTPGGTAHASPPVLQSPAAASPSSAASSASLRSSSTYSSFSSSGSSRIGLGGSSRLAASSGGTSTGRTSAAGCSSARTGVLAAAASCKPVARVLSFEDAADDAAAAPCAASSAGCGGGGCGDTSAARDQQRQGAAAQPAAAAGVPALPLGEPGLDADGYGSSAGDDFLAQHLQGFDSSGSNCTTWLSSDAACAKGRQGASLDTGASLPAAGDAGGGEGAHAAVRALWEQLLSKLGSLADAAGVPQAVLCAALAANDSSSEAGRTGAGADLTQQVLDAAADELQAGAAPERVAAQLLLPVLLLQLAGVAATAVAGADVPVTRPSTRSDDIAGSCSMQHVRDAVLQAVTAAEPQLLLALSGGGSSLAATQHQALTSSPAASSKAWLAASVRVGLLLLGGLVLLAAGLVAGAAVCALESEELHDAGLGGFSSGLAGLHSRLAA